MANARCRIVPALLIGCAGIGCGGLNGDYDYHSESGASGIRPERDAEAGLTGAAEEVEQSVQWFEANWADIRKVGEGFAGLNGWLVHGDAVVRLIRIHAHGGLSAAAQDNDELRRANNLALEHDLVAYRYTAWHVVAYANLLVLKPQLASLRSAFEADDRPFAGREDAERLLRELESAVQSVPEHAGEYLGVLRTDIPMTVGDTSIIVTSASIENVRKAMIEQSSKMYQLQVTIQQAVTSINGFLDGAVAEGMIQAIRGIIEARAGGRRGSRPGSPRIKAGPKSGRAAAGPGKQPQRGGSKKGGKKRDKRHANQKCSNAELASLQALMNRACKGGGADNSCSKSGVSAKKLARLPCSEVTRRLSKHVACLSARRRVQKKCFTSTDPGHAKAIRDRQLAVAWCQQLAAQQCAKGSPYAD